MAKLPDVPPPAPVGTREERGRALLRWWTWANAAGLLREGDPRRAAVERLEDAGE